MAVEKCLTDREDRDNERKKEKKKDSGKEIMASFRLMSQLFSINFISSCA